MLCVSWHLSWCFLIEVHKCSVLPTTLAPSCPCCPLCIPHPASWLCQRKSQSRHAACVWVIESTHWCTHAPPLSTPLHTFALTPWSSLIILVKSFIASQSYVPSRHPFPVSSETFLFVCLFIRKACQTPLPWLWSSLFLFNWLLSIFTLWNCSYITHCYTCPMLNLLSILHTPLHFCQSFLLYSFKIMKKQWRKYPSSRPMSYILPWQLERHLVKEQRAPRTIHACKEAMSDLGGFIAIQKKKIFTEGRNEYSL